MARLLLFEIFIFSSPFLIYGLYVHLLTDKETSAGVWEDAPLLNLGMVGILLVGAGILGYGLYWA